MFSKRYVGITAIMIAVWAASAPQSAVAHETGISFEKTVGSHIVDIGYEPEAPIAGNTLLLNVGLLNPDKSPAKFTSAWVRLKSGERTLLATGVHAAAEGPTTVLAELPADISSVTISVRYEKQGETLTETSFDLPVRSTDSISVVTFTALSLILGLVFGAGGSMLFLRRKD